MLTTIPLDDTVLQLSRGLVVLRAEADRLGRLSLSLDDRQKLSGRVSWAIEVLELAQTEPQLMSWRCAWSRLSKIRLAILASCWSAAVIALVVLVNAFPTDYVPASGWVSLLLLGSPVAAVFGAIFAGVPLSDSLETRRRILGALRFASRLEAGGRRPRAEAAGEPFVGPPAADLLVVTTVALAAVLAWRGLPATGFVIAVVTMVTLAVALGRRLRLRLALPETGRAATVVSITAVAAAFSIAGLGEAVGGYSDDDVMRAILLPLALAAYYGGCVALAEEKVRRNNLTSGDVWRDERPVLYWLFVVVHVTIAVALVCLAFLVP